MTNGENHEITSYQVARKALEGLIANPGRPTILLSGEWGSGKTWLVQKQIFSISTRKASVPDIDLPSIVLAGEWGSGDTGVTLWQFFPDLPDMKDSRPCIYLSVAVCQNLGDIKEQLEQAFLSKFASKGVSLLRDGIATIASLIPGVTSETIKLLKSTLKSGSELLSQSVLNEAMKDSVICFDDLDRLKNQKLIEEILFLGLEYKESWDCSVISILNDQKITKESYGDIFEKTIDRQVRLPEIDKDSFSELVKQACAKSLKTQIWQDAFLKIAQENHSQESGLRNLRLIQRFVFYAQEWDESLEEILPKLSAEPKNKIASLVTETIFKQGRKKWDDQFPRNVSPNEAAARERFSGHSFSGNELLSTTIIRQFENGYLEQGEALEGLLSRLADYWTADTQNNECETKILEMYHDFDFSPKEIVAAIKANFEKYIPEKTDKELMSLQHFAFQLNILDQGLGKPWSEKIDTAKWEKIYLEQIKKSSREFIGETLKFSDIGAPDHSARHQLREAVREILSQKENKEESSSEKIKRFLNNRWPLRSGHYALDPQYLEDFRSAISKAEWIDYLASLQKPSNLLTNWETLIHYCPFLSAKDEKNHEVQTELNLLAEQFKEIFTELDKEYPKRGYPIRCRKIYEDLGLLPKHNSREAV